MKKWILISTLFSLILICSSCKKEIEFTDIQRQVFNSYKIGDSLTFERNGFDTVRLIVDNIEHRFEQDKGWGSNEYFESAKISLRDYDEYGYVINTGFIAIGDRKIFISYSFFDVYASKYYKTDDIIVDNVKYQNVYYSTSSSDTVWFTPNEQIIKMKSKEGSVYERIR